MPWGYCLPSSESRGLASLLVEGQGTSWEPVGLIHKDPKSQVSPAPLLRLVSGRSASSCLSSREEPPDVLRSTPPVYLLFHPLILAIVSIWLLTGFLVMLSVFLSSSTILELSSGFLLPDAT